MNKNIAMGILGLAVLGTAVLANGAFASVGNRGQFGPNYSPERHAQMMQNGQGRGMMNGERGQNRGGNFIDANNDGICDRMQ
ncbi:MAG: hypothetical protein PHW24_00085 [Candidatus Moranbacteria bacterium]|nr:hypothetical protein [Candidatus Moranbacteria bacterium]